MDKLLLTLGFLIVVSIFVLAFVINTEGGRCVVNTCDYVAEKNLTCSYNYDPYTGKLLNGDLSLKNQSDTFWSNVEVT
jgi:hypothetical protein